MRITLRGSLAALAAGLALLPHLARAQSATVLVVPFAPGGGTDLTARVVQPALAAALGTSVIIKNTAGASGTIGGAEAARSAPDGRTLFFTPVGPIAIQPNLQRGIQYTADAFTPVCQVASVDVVMMTPKTSGFRTLADVIARAKAEDGNLPYGSSGIGTIPHISMVDLQRAAGIRMTHVPFRGGGEVMLAFQQGAVALFSDQPATVRQHDLHTIAVFAPARLPDMPDTPTMRELGYDLTYAIWTGIFAPAATPAAVLDRLDAACAATMREAAVIEGLKRIDTPAVYRDRHALAAFLAAENAKYRTLIETSGMRRAE